MMKEEKVLLIGIDSASLEIILKWKSYLPNLSSLMEKGSFGYLKSTIPPLSAPAWVSMVTGKNPGKTGVFDWITVPKKYSDRIRIVSMNLVKEPKVWEILGSYGIKSCIINLPLTYPATPLKGVMVSGIPGHIAERNITYPPSLKRKLDEVVGGYEIYPYTDLRVPGMEAEYYLAFKRILKKRLKAALWLIRNVEWQFFMLVFFILDSVQHYFWKYMDKQHPQFNPKYSTYYGKVIKDFYVKIDHAIGKLIKATDEDVNVIIVSDHGMGPCYGAFYINNLFMKEKILLLKNKYERLFSSSLRTKWIKTITTISNMLPNPLRRNVAKILPFELKENLTLRGQIMLESEELLKYIDWQRSKAYAIGECGGVFILDQESYDIIKSIIMKITLPYSKNIKIYRKYEVYKGKYIDIAPDIIVFPSGYKIKTSITSEKNIFSDTTISGYHTEYGIFIAAGPDIKHISSPITLSIYSILPIILKLFNIEAPPDIDINIKSLNFLFKVK